MKQFDEDDDRPVGTMTPAAISQLPPHEAVLFMNGLRPARIRARTAFDRKDVQSTTWAPQKPQLSAGLPEAEAEAA